MRQEKEANIEILFLRRYAAKRTQTHKKYMSLNISIFAFCFTVRIEWATQRKKKKKQQYELRSHLDNSTFGEM